MSDAVTADPLAGVLPDAADRVSWLREEIVTADDTREAVVVYRHTATGRALRLDETGRVYGEDAQGVVRVFGRGGALALAVALNAVYDGADHLRPSRVTLPETASV